MANKKKELARFTAEIMDSAVDTIGGIRFTEPAVIAAYAQITAHGCTVEDLIQLRMTLEFGALRMVIQNSTDEEIAELGELLQRYVGSETMEDREKHDLAFHTELVKMSHNPLFVYLLNAMMFMYEQNVNYSNQVVEDKDMMEETIDIHVRLYDAIRARDYTRAERVLTEHFDFTKDDLDRQTVYFFPQEQTE